MDLTDEQRAHYQRQKEIYFKLIGEYISNYAKLENYMVQIVSFHRANDKEARHKLMKDELAGYYSHTAFKHFRQVMISDHQQFLRKEKN